MMRKKFEFRDFFAKTRHKESFVANPSRYSRSLRSPARKDSRIVITREVRKFAADFKNDIHGIREMVDAVGSFELIPTTLARLAYGRRTANDIIATKKVPSIRRRVKVMQDYDFLIGCTDMCDALIASFHAKNIKAVHVRSVLDLQNALKLEGRGFMEKIMGHNLPHSYVRFEFQGKEYLADPFTSDLSKRIVPLNKNALNLLDLLTKVGKLRQGRDSWDKKIGLYSFSNFKKDKRLLQ